MNLVRWVAKLWAEGVIGVLSGLMTAVVDALLLVAPLGLRGLKVCTDGVFEESPSPVRSMTAQSGFDSPASHEDGILVPEGGVR